MNKQQGFVSIITTTIIMIIITLIVIGFSQLMNREQRQSLDRQLSSQALYAAETAINDVYDKLQKGTLVDEEKTTCDVTDWPVEGAGGIVDPSSSNETAYTCVLFDQTPAYLDFSNGGITTQQSKVIRIEPKSSDPSTKVQSLKLLWSGAKGNTDLRLPTTCSDPNILPQNMTPLGVPILRVDLVRLPKASTVNLNALTETDTTHFFLYPKGPCGASSSPYSQHVSTADKGKVIEVNCRNLNGFACEYEITGMNIVNTGSDRYFARIKSIYNDADVRIEGESTPSGAAIEFLGAQVMVDVTGKSNDVLRRIKVHLGNPNYPIPEFAVQGLDGICKGIQISPPSEVINSCGP